MAIKAIRINTDGSFTHVEVDDNISYHVGGGYFQAITSATGETTFWMDEEGKLKGLPVNQTATLLLYRLNPAFRQRDVLVGPVLVTGGADDEGETLPVSSEAIEALEVNL